MPYRLTLAAGILCAAALLASAPVHAISGTPEEQAACRPDVARHCKSVKAEEDEAFVQCLVSHAPQLSQRCRKVLETHGKLPAR
jgi:Cysteine rich repeat